FSPHLCFSSLNALFLSKTWHVTGKIELMIVMDGGEEEERRRRERERTIYMGGSTI
ncbi:hypothetical protein ACN38_g12742, partial [Penicillium nordicum]